MKKALLISALLLMTGLFNATWAQLEYFDPILSETARDGHIIYDRHFALNRTDLQRMNLKGQIKEIVENHDLRGGLIGGIWSDTIKFNKTGLFTEIVKPKKDEFNPNRRYNNTTYGYAYKDGDLQNSYKAEDHEMENGTEYRADIISFEYVGRNQPIKETHKHYVYKNKKYVPDSYQPTSSDWKYTYNIDQQIVSGTTGDGSEIVSYNNKGLLTDWEYVGSELKPTHFTYDANNLIISISRFELEEEFGEANYQITRNQQGDIVKVVHRLYRTNSKGVRTKPQQPLSTETYNVTYTYDSMNNWTKAIVKKTYSGRTSTFYTITRTFTYYSTEEHNYKQKPREL